MLPGCQHGTCTNPLECKCFPGWRGFLCEQGLCEISLYFIVLNSQLTISKFITSIIAICSATCSKTTGYCTKPGTCRCKIGWMGESCTQCHPYPGCQNGDCRRPWVISFKLYIFCNKKSHKINLVNCYHTISIGMQLSFWLGWCIMWWRIELLWEKSKHVWKWWQVYVIN